MGKFRLSEVVRLMGSQEVRTVVEVHVSPGREIQYWVQLGNDLSSRELANESELELAEPPKFV